MKDFNGLKLNKGDFVVFNYPGYKGLIRGMIVDFTLKQVKISYKRYERDIEFSITHSYPGQVVRVITPKDIDQIHMDGRARHHYSADEAWTGSKVYSSFIE